MRRHVDYKVPGGKLIRIDIVLEGMMIKRIMITGDFFIHPEGALERIEEALAGTEVTEADGVIGNAVSRESAMLVGFSAKDLADAIRMCLA